MSAARRLTQCSVLLVPILFFVPRATYADPVTLLTRTAFEAAVGTTLVDDYSHSGYRSGNITNGSDLDRHTDASMTAVLGETSYETTGRSQFNLVFNQDENPRQS